VYFPSSLSSLWGVFSSLKGRINRISHGILATERSRGHLGATTSPFCRSGRLCASAGNIHGPCRCIFLRDLHGVRLHTCLSGSPKSVDVTCKGCDCVDYRTWPLHFMSSAVDYRKNFLLALPECHLCPCAVDSSCRKLWRIPSQICAQD